MTIDRLHVVVLLCATTLVLLAGRGGHMPWVLVGWFVFLLVLTATLSMAPWRSREVSALRWVVRAAVLLSVYESIGGIIAGLGGPARDGWVVAIEQATTGGRLPPLAPIALPPGVIDAFSLAYVAYFVLPIVLLAALLRRRDQINAQRAMLTVLMAFYLHYAIYILVPAVGPIHAAEVPAAIRAQLLAEGGWITHSVRTGITALEGTPQDAFPSAHTSVALLVAAFARRHQIQGRIVLYGLAAAIIAGTMLLGYHYVVDVVAAAPVALLAWGLGATPAAR